MSADPEAVVLAVAYRMQIEWKPEYAKIVRTALDVVHRGDWRDFANVSVVLPPLSEGTET